MDDVFLSDANREDIMRLVREHGYADQLRAYGLPLNNKILLQGESGCGKTTTAKGIAAALGKKIIILDLNHVICSRIGETSQNIKMVFDKAARERAVLFLDEFDSLGKARTNFDKDVGEMRRLVNAIIQAIDYYPDHSLLIAATNHPDIIDGALLRRFQLKIDFEMPTVAVLDHYYDRILEGFPEHAGFVERKYGISFAEARDHAYTHLKYWLIESLEAAAKENELTL